jgi:hypothetical protein
MHRAGALLILLIGPALLLAQSGSAKDEAYDQLAKAFKPVLASAVPKTLYDRSDNWGHQVMVPVGVKWHGLRPEVSKSPRNHGEWRRLTITARNLGQTLDLRIFDVKTADADKQTFKVYLAFQMGVEYEQQNWESGARLWSGSVRARAQVKLDMECENTLRFETDKNNLPELVLRMRVTNARLHYDDLVFEHVNGVGGDAAKLIGAGAHRCMNQWRPSIERDLLAKANAAIVKAADTREIRVGFGGLLKSSK